MQRDATPNARDGDPRQHVVVAGGGILGCLTSLLLAECGRAVTLVDAGRELWQGASAAGEGKVHLGLVYSLGSPDSRQSMLRTALDFGPLVERAVGRRVDWPALTSDPFDYLVMPDSLASAEELAAVYRSLDDEHSRLGRPPYLGLDLDRIAAGRAQADPTGLPAFATAERAVDPDRLRAIVVDAIERRAPAVRVISGSRVTAVDQGESGVRVHLDGDESAPLTAAAMVDARWAWQGFGVQGVRARRRNLRVKSAAILPAGASERTVTLVVGPYGDVVPRADSVYVSWYPEARRAHEHRAHPSSRALAALAQATVRGSAHDSSRRQCDALAELGLVDHGVEPIALRAGLIVGDGAADIDSPRSGLHDRRGFGSRVVGRVVLPRSLKFSTAPRAATQAVSAVLPLLGAPAPEFAS